MKVDIPELSNHFSTIKFHIVDVRHAVINPGQKCFGVTTPPCSGFVFPLRGRARMFFSGVPYEMEAGKIFHFGPCMSLDKEVLGDAYWDHIIVHYKVEEGENSSSQYSTCHYEVYTGFIPRLPDLLLQMYLYCANPNAFSPLKAKMLFFNILDELLSHASCHNGDNNRTLINEATNFIKAHYMNPLAIPELATQYGLKTKQFAYLFRKYTGLSPIDYLIDYRIRRAQELLSHTTCSIGEISICVGYSDPYYFSKLFKKRTGFSPSTLRNYKTEIV